MKTEKAVFKVFQGGPIEVSGNFEIQGPDGKVLETKDVIYLCRCGGSANKPFCDGTHKRSGFDG